MLHLGFAVAIAFTPPMTQLGGLSSVCTHEIQRCRTPVAIGSFFGGGDDFTLYPTDVEFTDVDGDSVVIRPTTGKKVDFFVNRKLRLKNAVLVKNGNMLEITGTITKGTPFSMIGFNLEDIVTEGTTPRDPADCDKAMECIA